MAFVIQNKFKCRKLLFNITGQYLNVKAMLLVIVSESTILVPLMYASIILSESLAGFLFSNRVIFVLIFSEITSGSPAAVENNSPITFNELCCSKFLAHRLVVSFGILEKCV
jgi:hypothetical protein